LLGRLRLPCRYPASLLVCGPPTPSLPSASAMVIPCLRPTSVRTLVLHRRRLRPQTRRASGLGHRVPAIPDAPEEERGPPRSLGRPLRARHGRRLRGMRRPLAPAGNAAAVFRIREPLDIPETTHFEAHFHGSYARAPTHRRAGWPYHGARLTTDLPGSALVGRVSHPLDDFSEFHEVTACPSLLSDQPCLVAPRMEYSGGTVSSDGYSSSSRLMAPAFARGSTGRPLMGRRRSPRPSFPERTGRRAARGRRLGR